jgi:hypothetical protein
MDMATKGEIRDYVDEYAALAVEEEGIKTRIDWLKGQFEQLALGQLKDTKLMKKLKGAYAKDKATLMNVTGMGEEEASDAAYLIAEVVDWERLVQILNAAEWSGTVQEAVVSIKAATPRWSAPSPGLTFAAGHKLIEALKKYVANAKRKGGGTQWMN